MKKISRKFILWALLFSLLPTLLTAEQFLNSAGRLVHNNDWAGVLHIWSCANAPFGNGSPLPWLNERASAFEKLHLGVRIQVTETPQETLASFSKSTYPPDIIIFTPGTLHTAGHLCVLEPPANLSLHFKNTGISDSEIRALPIAAGGYFWFCADSSLKAPPGSTDCPLNYTFHAPPDTSNFCYSAAMLALFSGEIPSDPAAAEPGADLGLPQESATVPPQTNFVPLKKPTSFASDIRNASARSMFTAGDTDAFIGTAQDIRRLSQLADSGRAPEYSIFSGGAAFTDLLAMAAVVDHTGPDSSQRERLCADFITFLLTEESQSALKNVLAFRTTEGAPLYTSFRNGMSEAEAVLSGPLIVPNAFDTAWRDRAARAADLFLKTNATADELLSAVFP